MRECQVCGLLFGGGNRCPECKAIFGSEIEPMNDDGVPSGPLPGASGLADILTEVEGISGPAKESKPASNLPFTIGASRSSDSVELPFGTGALGTLRVDDPESEDGDPSPPSSSEFMSIETTVSEQKAVEESASVNEYQDNVVYDEVIQEAKPTVVVTEDNAPSSKPPLVHRIYLLHIKLLLDLALKDFSQAI